MRRNQGSDLTLLLAFAAMLLACKDGGPPIRQDVEEDFEVCAAFASNYTTCVLELPDVDVSDAVVYVQAIGVCLSELGDARRKGDECRIAREDLAACVSSLSCAELLDDEPACTEELAAKEAACDSAGEDGGSTG